MTDVSKNTGRYERMVDAAREFVRHECGGDLPAGAYSVLMIHYGDDVPDQTIPIISCRGTSPPPPPRPA